MWVFLMVTPASVADTREADDKGGMRVNSRAARSRRVRRFVHAAAVAALAALGTLGASRPAAADVVTPAGTCVGSGMWLKSGLRETSTAHDPNDTISVPRADTVKWSGNIKGYALGSVGPERKIDGAVQLVLPIGTATIDSWGKSSVRYANEGEHRYDLPSVLIGVRMKLKGFHKDNGKLTCSGSVYVKVAGSATRNPLTYVALGGLVISAGLLLFAGRPVFKKIYAFEDYNPG